MVEEVSRLLSQARGAYQREQYDVALAYFQRACEVDSHSPEALLGVGEVSSFLGLRDQAIRAFLSLADLYLRAAMFEVAAEVIERIVDLDPQNPIGLRFQRFIQPRLRPGAGEQVTAVTAVERRQQKPLELERWERADSVGPTNVSTEVVERDLDDLIGDIATPVPETRQLALAETRLAQTPSPVLGPTRSRFSVTITGARDDADEPDDDDESASEIRTRTFAGEITDLDPDPKKMEVIFDFGDDDDDGDVDDDEDDDLASYTELDPEPDEAAEETELELDPSIFYERRDPQLIDTAVSPPSAALLAAIGSGRHQPIDAWDVNTEAAVVAENHRKRPAISIDAGDDELDLADFPSIEEKDSAATATKTIALEEKDAAMLLEELAPVSPFITQLGPGGRLELLEKGSLLQCFAGQVICREGDIGRDLYLLLSGQAAVERVLRDSGSPQRLASLSPGAFFGEGSVLADSPRSSTVRIIDDALLVEIGRTRLQEMVKERPHLLTVLTRFLRARLVSSLMMSSPLFGGLEMQERAALAPLLHLHKLNPGQQVVRRGQLLTGFCTIMAGELERFDLADGTGKQVHGPIRAGDSFGTNCLRDEPSSTSIGAVTGCWLMRLPTQNLRDLVARHPEVLEALAAADLLA